MLATQVVEVRTRANEREKERDRERERERKWREEIERVMCTSACVRMKYNALSR